MAQWMTVSERSPFAGGDQSYLRDVQYRDGTNLDIRAALHQRFATSEVGMAILRYPMQSLDDAVGGDDDDDDRSRHDLLADEEADDIEERLARQEAAGDWVARLVDDRPGWFDPAMRYFFEQVLGNGFCLTSHFSFQTRVRTRSVNETYYWIPKFLS